MRKSDMEIGKQYIMQRGPTRKPRKVTLLDKSAPSGGSHWVLVRIEEGVGAKREIEAPSASIQPLPGEELPKRSKKRRGAPKRPLQAPSGWVPAPGEAVAWTQTLGTRSTVLTVDPARGIARIKGKVMGMLEEFDAPIAELSPYFRELSSVPEEELEDRLDGSLPEKLRAQGSEVGSMPEPVEEAGEDLVDRLTFSPSCIDFYRRRFARGVSREKAASRLREELRAAKKMRKRHTGEYLRLRVVGRFDAVLKQSPSLGGFQALYVEGLQLPARPKRKKRRKAA